MINERHVSDSRTIQTYLLLPGHMNASNTLYGGQLLSWIDMLAGIVAMRHCDSKVVTMAVDSLVFKEPAYSGDVITLDGRVTWVGRSSLEVRVDTWRENKGGIREPINTAYLVMVCLSDEGRPQPAPRLVPETDEERNEWQRAEKRSALRRERKAEQI